MKLNKISGLISLLLFVSLAGCGHDDCPPPCPEKKVWVCSIDVDPYIVTPCGWELKPTCE